MFFFYFMHVDYKFPAFLPRKLKPHFGEFNFGTGIVSFQSFNQATSMADIHQHEISTSLTVNKQLNFLTDVILKSYSLTAGFRFKIYIFSLDFSSSFKTFQSHSTPPTQ